MSALTRARRLLARPGGWIEAIPGGYGLRGGADRRSRVSLVIDEVIFRQLIVHPGLRVRPGGGWTARHSGQAAAAGPAPGRPGVIDGYRTIMEADGRVGTRQANLGRSAVAWLAHRKDADGLPWLSPAEVAAAERLGMEAELALRGPSLTMRWDALPRSGGGSSARIGPDAPALAAGRRVAAALAACGPARAIVERICIDASALQAAERDLGLARRAGKSLLRTGLRALAEHYRIG